MIVCNHELDYSFFLVSEVFSQQLILFTTPDLTVLVHTCPKRYAQWNKLVISDYNKTSVNEFSLFLS